MSDELVPAPDDAPDLEALPEKWKIHNQGGAEWAMTRYANAQRLIAALDVERDAWIARVNEWHAEAVKPLQNTADYFDIHLQDYAMRTRDESPRDKKGEPTVKTVLLVTGRISTTGAAERIEIVDKDVVIAWAQTTQAVLDEPAGDGICEPWVDGNGVTKWIATVADLGVVRTVPKLQSIDALRTFLHVVEVDRQSESGDGTPEVIRQVIGPDGAVVPGVEIVPASVRARVQPNTITEQKEH